MAKDVETQKPVLTNAQLASIQSFDDALALIQSEFGGQVIDVTEELGNGFHILENKDRLVDVPFVVLEVRESEGDYGKSFVSLTVVAQSTGNQPEKWIVNDGSTGIRDQIMDFYARSPEKVGTPLLVKGGLRKSAYYFDDKTGDVSSKPKDGYAPASTYYLNI